MERRLSVAVAGAGHFGRYHVLKLAAEPRARLAGLFDPDRARAGRVAAEAGGCRVFESLDAMVAGCEAAIIATPTFAHHATAKAVLAAGRHALIEKPIAATLAEADELIALARARGLVLQVGHVERFSPVQVALARRPVRPLYMEITRIAPYKPRGTDVSVILDLMIHDIDLALALAKAPITSVEAVGAPLVSATEDIANARLGFANGCVAAITASRVSQKTERRMRLYEADRYTVVDFAARTLRAYTRGATRGAGESQPGVPDLALAEESFPDADALAAEDRAFIASVLDGAPVLVDGEVGRRALAAAIEIADNMAARRALWGQSGLMP
ncbi:MAG: Gfo/Idh/MocA family oxidoreductase [Alphaproteobacteria bacterium]|nr:Gfo/Idh/MocA family oxidoreductase [Alphaproteobacteria bacterium]